MLYVGHRQNIITQHGKPYDVVRCLVRFPTQFFRTG
jgi:hypothetical protein